LPGDILFLRFHLVVETAVAPEIFALGLRLFLPFEPRHFRGLVLLQTGCAMGEHLAACFLESHFQKFLRYGDLIDFVGQHFPKGIDISGFMPSALLLHS